MKRRRAVPSGLVFRAHGMELRLQPPSGPICSVIVWSNWVQWRRSAANTSVGAVLSGAASSAAAPAAVLRDQS